jgi:hypothetical protein
LSCCSAAIHDHENSDTLWDVKTIEYYLSTLTCIANNLLSVIWLVQLSLFVIMKEELKQRWSIIPQLSVKWKKNSYLK